jgi:hypothetical protein
MVTARRLFEVSWIWIAGALALIALAITVDIVVTLFPRAHAIPDDQLAAGATLLGGLIGAAGTAFAVYLTLASQRRDDARKVEAALRMEVAEFSRLAAGAISPYESALTGEYYVPMCDLPVLTSLPEPSVYKAAADRLSRLPDGPLFVAFYLRIAEAVQLARILSATAKPVFHPNGTQMDPLLDAQKAKTLATGWLDVCNIGQTILRKKSDAQTLIDATIAATLTDIAETLKRVGPLVKPANAPASAPAPGLGAP